MEYADNGTLRNYLKESYDSFSWADKINMAYQLACAVLCLHNEGIVHCDLVIFIIFQRYEEVLFLIYFDINYFNNSIPIMCWLINIKSK